MNPPPTLPSVFRHIALFLLVWLSPLVVAAPSDNLNKGVFLVATKKLNDTSFEKSVIYITEYGENGTYGLIVNHKTPVPLDEIVPEAKVEGSKKQWLFFGGPMHSQFLFLITRTNKSDGLHPITHDIWFGAGKETVARISARRSTDPIRAFAGFSSWGPGQLESEVNDGSWVLAPGDEDSLFQIESEKLWQQLFDRWAGSWI